MHLIEPLCCKPPNDKPVVYEQGTPLGSITLASLDIDDDLPLIHDWVNRPYAEPFWLHRKIRLDRR